MFQRFSAYEIDFHFCKIIFSRKSLVYNPRTSNMSDNLSSYFLDHREIFDWFLDHGLDINAGGDIFFPGRDKTYRDNTVYVLNCAANKGNIELFEYSWPKALNLFEVMLCITPRVPKCH